MHSKSVLFWTCCFGFIIDTPVADFRQIGSRVPNVKKKEDKERSNELTPAFLPEEK